jgi:V8-like Glu-specific endopeptidase
VLAGCASGGIPRNHLGQSEIQQAILANNIPLATEKIKHGPLINIYYSGWKPTAFALALRHEDISLLEAIIARKEGSVDHITTMSYLELEELEELACHNLIRFDASQTVRPLLRELIDADDQCVSIGQSFAAVVYQNADQLSSETLSWALGSDYKNKQLLLALQYDPAKAMEILKSNSPEELGFSSQDALRSAYVGANRAAIQKVVDYGASPSLISKEDWQPLICQSLAAGVHEPDVITGMIQDYGEAKPKCDPGRPLRDGNMVGFEASLRGNDIKLNSPEFQSVFAWIEYRDDPEAMAVLAKVYGANVLSKDMLAKALGNDKAKQILIFGMNAPKKHELACELLAANTPLDESDRQIIKDGVRLAQKCGSNKLPIFVAQHVPDNFLFIYELDPKVYRRAVTKLAVLKSALQTGRSDIVEAVAADSKAQVRQLSAEDIIPIANQGLLLTKLEKYGLPKEHRTYAEVAAICAQHPFDETRTLINQSFFTSYTPVLTKYEGQPEALDTGLMAYRSCLKTRERSLRSANPFVTKKGAPPRVNEDIYATAKARTLYALSLLGSRNAESQNAHQAREIIYDGYESIRQNIELFKEESEKYASQKKQELNEAFDEALKRREEAHGEVDSATWFAAGVTAVVTGVMAYNDIDPSEFLEMSVNTILQKRNERTRQIENNFTYAINAINATNIDIPKLEDHREKKLDKDGVRLLVPRYGIQNPYGSLSSSPVIDHTHAVIKIRKGSGGHCTGAVLSGMRILTAQHCILDNDLKIEPSIGVHNDYFSVRKGTLIGGRDTYEGPWKYTTAKQRYIEEGEKRWENDWAILEPLNKNDRSIPAFLRNTNLSMVPGEAHQSIRRNKDKIAIAGYAGHLNHGIYLTMDWGCSTTAFTNEIIEDNCRGFGGDSGSPVVMIEGRHKGKVLGVRSYGRGGDQQGRLPYDNHGSVSTAHIQRELASARVDNGVIQ